MTLAFKFTYLNDKDTLVYLLNFYAQNSGLEYGIKIIKDDVILYVNGEEKNILKFTDESISQIPNSIFLSKSEVNVVDEFFSDKPDIKNPNLANLTLKSIKNYYTKKEISQNEFGILSDISVFDGENFTKVTMENFNDLINFCATSLMHYQDLILKDSNFNYKIKAEIDFNYDYIMPSNPKNISKIFVCDEKSLIALASFEKPIINLKTNSIFRKNHPEAKSSFDVKMAGDFFIYALLHKLNEENINFLSVKIENKDLKPFKVAALEDRFIIIDQGCFIKKEDLDFINSKNDKSLALFGLICKEFDILDKKNLKIKLSKEEDDEIIFYKDKNEFSMLKINIPSSFEELKNQICSDETGTKLYKNFTNSFKFPQAEIKYKKNFYSLLDMASKILFAEDKNSDYLLECAKDFSGTKGLKIDYALNEKNKFDVCKFIRTGMSYKLAGVDDRVLSWGYISSLAYFLSDYLDILKEEFDFENAIFMGSMFEFGAFSNLTLKLSGKNHNAKFSNKYAIKMH